MASLKSHYNDLYYLSFVSMRIPVWNMVGKTYEVYGMETEDWGVFTGTLSAHYLKFNNADFTAGIAGSTGQYFSGRKNNIWFVENVFSAVYKECNLANHEECTPEGDHTTKYDLEIYLEGATMTPEGYIKGDDAFEMQLLLAGTSDGLYGGSAEPGSSRVIFAGRKQLHVPLTEPKVEQNGRMGYGFFGMHSQISSNFDEVSFDVNTPDILGWKNPDHNEHAGDTYQEQSLRGYHTGPGTLRPLAYWMFEPVMKPTKVGGFTAGSVNICTDPLYRWKCWPTAWGTKCGCAPAPGGGGGTGSGGQQQPTAPTPSPSSPPPGGGGGTGGGGGGGFGGLLGSQQGPCWCWVGPGPAGWYGGIYYCGGNSRQSPGPGTTNTTASQLSSNDCGPCPVTSKPYLLGRTNGSGVPSTIKAYNTSMYTVSSLCTAVLMYINAPIKQEGYRVGQILFWAGIDSDGAIVSLSDPRYTDYTSDTTISENIVTLPTSLQKATPGAPGNAFSTYNILPLHVFRDDSDMVALQSEMKNPGSLGNGITVPGTGFTSANSFSIPTLRMVLLRSLTLLETLL